MEAYRCERRAMEAPASASEAADAWPERWPQTVRDFERLVDLHLPRLLQYASRRLGNIHDAEDVVQDVLVRAYLFGHTQRVSRPAPWLFTVTANACKDLLRARQRRLGRECQAATASLDEVLNAQPAARLANEAEAALRVDQLLGRLPRKQAETIRLRFFAGLDLKEIAAVMECSVSTVNSRLRYGFRKLRRVVGKEQQK